VAQRLLVLLLFERLDPRLELVALEVGALEHVEAGQVQVVAVVLDAGDVAQRAEGDGHQQQGRGGRDQAGVPGPHSGEEAGRSRGPTGSRGECGGIVPHEAAERQQIGHLDVAVRALHEVMLHPLFLVFGKQAETVIMERLLNLLVVMSLALHDRSPFLLMEYAG